MGWYIRSYHIVPIGIRGLAPIHIITGEIFKLAFEQSNVEPDILCLFDWAMDTERWALRYAYMWGYL